MNNIKQLKYSYYIQLIVISIVVMTCEFLFQYYSASIIGLVFSVLEALVTLSFTIYSLVTRKDNPEWPVELTIFLAVIIFAVYFSVDFALAI